MFRDAGGVAGAVTSDITVTLLTNDKLTKNTSFREDLPFEAGHSV